MMAQAQVRGCPEARGLGRLRQRVAVMARARSRYSSFRWSRQNASVSATMASYVACMARGTDVEREDLTVWISHRAGPHNPGCLFVGPPTNGEPTNCPPAIKDRLGPGRVTTRPPALGANDF